MVTVHRDSDGVRIQGERYAVSIHPLSEWRAEGDATLSLTVDARSARWGHDWARLTSDLPHYFTAAELELAQTAAGADELRAGHIADDDLPGFRTGFTLMLEAGMRAYLETELPRVERVAHLAAALRAAVEPPLGRELAQYAWTTLLPHEAAALVAIASRIVLDGYVPAEAIHYAVMLHDGRWGLSEEGAGGDPQYAELGAALRTPEVITLLDAAREVAA